MAAGHDDLRVADGDLARERLDRGRLEADVARVEVGRHGHDLAGAGVVGRGHLEDARANRGHLGRGVLGHDRGHDVAAEGRPRLLQDPDQVRRALAEVADLQARAVGGEAGPAGVGDPGRELAAERAGPEEHHLRLPLADEVGDCLLVNDRIEGAEERMLDDVDDVGAGGDQLGRPVARGFAREYGAHALAQAVRELADLAQELQ